MPPSDFIQSENVPFRPRVSFLGMERPSGPVGFPGPPCCATKSRAIITRRPAALRLTQTMLLAFLEPAFSGGGPTASQPITPSIQYPHGPPGPSEGSGARHRGASPTRPEPQGCVDHKTAQYWWWTITPTRLIHWRRCSICSAVRYACYDGPAALAMAATFEPHVCLLDLVMPQMDGLELAAQLKARPGSQPLLLIATTALGDWEARTKTALGRLPPPPDQARQYPVAG